MKEILIYNFESTKTSYKDCSYKNWYKWLCEWRKKETKLREVKCAIEKFENGCLVFHVKLFPFLS